MRLDRALEVLTYPLRWRRAAWRVGPSRASWVLSYEAAWRSFEAQR